MFAFIVVFLDIIALVNRTRSSVDFALMTFEGTFCQGDPRFGETAGLQFVYVSLMSVI